MKPEIKVEDMPERPTLAIRESATMASIPERMGKIFSEIMVYMSEKGIAPAGPPFAYWHNMNAESKSKGVFDMECGFPVAMPMEGEGRIRPGKLPGGEVITAVHIGPYEALAQTYEAIQTWIRELGYQVEEDLWETYLTDPHGEPDSSQWMTKIFWPMKRP